MNKLCNCRVNYIEIVKCFTYYCELNQMDIYHIVAVVDGGFDGKEGCA
jgi:hypothetical protein